MEFVLKQVKMKKWHRGRRVYKFMVQGGDVRKFMATFGIDGEKFFPEHATPALITVVFSLPWRYRKLSLEEFIRKADVYFQVACLKGKGGEVIDVFPPGIFKRFPEPKYRNLLKGFHAYFTEVSK